VRRGAACAAHSYTVRPPSDVVVPGCLDATVTRSSCPRPVSVAVSGTRPSSVRCPVGTSAADQDYDPHSPSQYSGAGYAVSFSQGSVSELDGPTERLQLGDVDPTKIQELPTDGVKFL
jgi:hypothetical protein